MNWVDRNLLSNWVKAARFSPDQALRIRLSCRYSSLPRLGPAFTTVVSEARTSTTGVCGRRGGSRRCLAAPTPPVLPVRRRVVASVKSRCSQFRQVASALLDDGETREDRTVGVNMNLYAIVSSGIGTTEATSLSARLAAWHDTMVAHERRLRSESTSDGCDDACPHVEARTLWAEALETFGPRANDLVFLRSRAGHTRRRRWPEGVS
jgi:hypothetical protein